MNSITRFSGRVADYVRYRPSYPPGVADVLARECGLAPNSRVADIGAGTGILTTVFADYGCDVTAVEPNPEMREAAERFLAGRPRVRVIDGVAEATTLSDAAYDLVAAGQAFHWFDPAGARAEFRRILRPGGWVVLVWNERAASPGFMAGYDELVVRYGPEHPHVQTEEFDRLFAPNGWRSVKLANAQSLDLAALQGRFLSSSYAPRPGTAGYQPLLDDLRKLFEAHQSDDRVAMEYQTEIYFGQLT